MVEAPGRTGHGKVLVFKLGESHYSLELEYVREVMKPVEITRVPFMVHFLKGVINFRGNIVPVLDLGAAALGTQVNFTTDTRFIIVELKINSGEELVGLIVDGVIGARTAGKAVSPPEELLPVELSSFSKGVSQIDSRMVVHLDIRGFLLLKRNVLNQVSALNGSSQGH